MKNFAILFLAMLSIFSACKDKEDEVDPCSNGFIDTGEDGVDCGGNCTPCVEYNPPSLSMLLNGLPFDVTSKSLTYNDTTWTLNVTNDTISFQFNLGTDGNVGTFSMNPSGSYGYKNGNFYNNVSQGIYSISAHDLSNHTLSGFFQANFYRIGFTDTLKVTGGQFSYMSY